MSEGKRRVRPLLFSSFGAIAALLMLIQTLAYIASRETQAGVDALAENALVSIKLVQRIALDIERKRILVDEHIIEQGPPVEARIEKQLAELDADQDAAARQYEALATFPGEANAWRQLQEDVAATRGPIDEVLALSRQNLDAQARAAFVLLGPRFAAIERDVDVLVELNQASADGALAAVRRVQRNGLRLRWATAGGAVCLTLAVGFWVSGLISRREDQLERYAGILENEKREVEQAHGRLGLLYEISKLLAPAEGVMDVVSRVLERVGSPLHARSVIVALRDPAAAAPQLVAWQAEGQSAEALQSARAHARTRYDRLVRARGDLGGSAGSEELEADPSFVVLPLVVGRGAIFGALQIEGSGPFAERDLVFESAVAHQLAIALERHAADRALRMSEARLAGIVFFAADAIISVDEAQGVVMYNESAEQIFGWSRGEVLGKPLDMLFPAGLREVPRQQAQRATADLQGTRSMGAGRQGVIGLRKSGQVFPAEAAISMLEYDGARLSTVILRDVTEQRRIQHEERFLAETGVVLSANLDFQGTIARVAQLAVRELGDYCVIEIVDEHGEVQRLEALASDSAKVEIAEALKRFPVDSSRLTLRSAVLQSRKSQLMSEISPETLRAVAQSEEHRRVLEAVAATSAMGVPLIAQGRLLGALIVMSCRPERRYEAADLRLLEEVGRRASLAIENARLYLAVERAVQARDDILGIVAHDLRNPLAGILVQAELLRRRGVSDGGSRKPADMIERAATRMNRLIQDLLDVTRMEAGHLSIERARVGASQILFDAADAQKPVASTASIALQVEVAEGVSEVWGDRDRLLQVFENLIGNSIKFTAAGGRIVVGAAPRDGEVLFRVSDTGTGIAAEDLPHLFDRFWQSRKVGRTGAGLGLPIVKSIVEAHCGRIWIESIPGRGSTFFFTIPTAPQAERR